MILPDGLLLSSSSVFSLTAGHKSKCKKVVMQIFSLYKILLETKVVLHHWHLSKLHTVSFLLSKRNTGTTI